jgi:hypothetical protein
MTPEKSSACSQKLATDPYPDQMNPAHTFPSYLFVVILILISHLCIGIPSGLYPSGLFFKIRYAFPFPPMPTGKKHIYPDSCYFLHLTSKYCPTLFSKTPPVYVLSLMWKTTFHTHIRKTTGEVTLLCNFI